MTEVHPAPSVTPLSRWTVPGLVALALIPVTYLTVRSLLAMRNAAYWDEIETVLDFLLKVQASPTWPDTLAQLFSTGNEHRTMTSRLLFAVSYWLTGSVNFVALLSKLPSTCASRVRSPRVRRRSSGKCSLRFNLFDSMIAR